MLFMAPGLVFIFPGGFLLSLMVPGWIKSELSAAGAKWDVKNTKKVLTSSVSWPHDPARPCRLRPSDDDDEVEEMVRHLDQR